MATACETDILEHEANNKNLDESIEQARYLKDQPDLIVPAENTTGNS